MPDLILTGIPRSGTSLAATLVDGLPDAVCLQEPYWQFDRIRRKDCSAERFAAWLREDFTRVRDILFKGKEVEDRRDAQGEPVTDYFQRRWRDGRMEVERSGFGIISFARHGLSPDFLLGMKHNGPYLSVLPQIIALKHFIVIAIIRDPVQTILSWRTLTFPLSRGEMPGAIAYWPELRALTQASIDLLEKQVRIYDLFCQRLHASREAIHIITYESLVAQPGLLAAALARKPGRVPAHISPAHEPAGDEAAAIRKLLLRHAFHARHFYDIA